MQLGFRSGWGTTDALFVVKKMQEEYRDIWKWNLKENGVGDEMAFKTLRTKG